MSLPTTAWRTSTACAPAFVVAALGAVWVGAHLSADNGYFGDGYQTLALDAFRVEFDRNMLVALAATFLVVLPAVWLRGRGFTGKTMLAAAILATVAPVGLSIWFAPEWRQFDSYLKLTAGSSWQDTPLPRALRHPRVIGGTLLAALAGAIVLAYLGRRGPASPARVAGGGHLARFAVIAPLALWGLAHLGAAVFGPEAASSPRHVIFLTWDSTRADHMSCLGHPRRTTPVFDALAADGVLFERAYAQNNWTRPSYASIVTSLSHYKIHDRGRIRSDVTTIAEVMKKHGYHTMSVVQNPNLDARWGFEQGYDEYYHVISRHDSDPDAITKLAIPRIRELAKSDQPMFLFIHFQEPHWPYRDGITEDAPIEPEAAHRVMSVNHFETVPSNVEEIVQFFKEGYENDIRATDRAMGDLLAAIKDCGLYEEALIVYTSDHGDEFFEHKAFGHGHDNLHPELTWVPMMMRFPDSHKIAPRRVSSTVRNLDIIPTILDVVGIDLPAMIEGESLLPLDRLAAEPRISTCNAGTILMLRNDQYAALVDPRQKATPVQYFDLAKDPAELEPLAATAIGDAVKTFDQHTKAWFASYLAVLGLDDLTQEADDGSKINPHHHMDEDLREQLRSLGYVK